MNLEIGCGHLCKLGPWLVHECGTSVLSGDFVQHTHTYYHLAVAYVLPVDLHVGVTHGGYTWTYLVVNLSPVESRIYVLQYMYVYCTF